VVCCIGDLKRPVGLAWGTRRNVSSNGWKRIWQVNTRSPAQNWISDSESDPFYPVQGFVRKKGKKGTSFNKQKVASYEYR
jgi:hypothetical protein